MIEEGYVYELAGLFYYAFFLYIGRSANATRFSMRSRILTLSAAIALVACVPLHYARSPYGEFIMLGLAIATLVSTFLDRRTAT